MEFQSFVITNKGQALMAKLMLGSGTADFTKICLSSHVYTSDQLQDLTALADIKQTASISSKTVINTTSFQVEGAIDNTELSTGYDIQTVGIYATDPDEGEILYAVAIAVVAGWMPPYNGVTVSGAVFKFVITVGNAANVTLTVDPAGYATINDIQNLQGQITDLKGYVGYVESDIYGVEVDFVNKTFKRLAGAVGKTPGSDFDGINAFGGRYRCNLTDAGVELSAYGETGYSETGALTVAVEKDGVTYAVGTKVQVMVKQPKFYYKVVPLQLEPISGGKGFHMRKARYYVSDTPKEGFKLHPAFLYDKTDVKDCIYESAYEGSIYDTSASTYIMNDVVTADFTASTGDKLSSIAGAKPASGISNNLTRRNCATLAANRGTGWCQEFIQLTAADEMLFLIEYASFNTQAQIGEGNVNKTDDGSTSMTEVTGATTALGNASGEVTNGNNVKLVSYRGKENIWGNIWIWVDGLNIECKNIHDLWVNTKLNGFKDDTKASSDGMELVGFTACKANGYVSAFGYTPDFDWLFIASEVDGNSANSSVPVGDYYYQSYTYNGFLVSILGGKWDGGLAAGGFFWHLNNASGGRARGIGGRLAYVPGVA